MAHILEIKNLTKYYGKHRGVSDVSFRVEEGDIFGFLGPNGAGKSTIIRSMLGLIHFQEGSIQIFGRDIRKDKEAVLHQIGYMPSETMFYPSMKVKEVLQMAADVRKKDCKEEAEKLCSRLQLDTSRRIRDLSLGNRKKVGIVCSMQHKPRLFVFDEPTSGLDPLMQAEFFKLVQEYVQQGATCLLSTHVLSEVKRFCRNVAMMKEGRLQCVDTVANLTRSSAKRVQVVRDGRQENYLYNGVLTKLLKELAESDVEDLLIEEPSLDEIFLHYYQEE